MSYRLFLIKISFLFIGTSFYFSLPAQQWQWVKNCGTGSSYQGIEVGNGIACDNLGYVYVVYRLADNSYPHYDQFFGTDTTNLWKDGEMFLAKYDSSGVMLWHKALTQYEEFNINSIGTLQPSEMKIDNNGFIYITGSAHLHRMIFAADTISVDNDLTSVFLLKCDTAANPVWFRLSSTQPPTNNNVVPLSAGMDLDIDRSGNILVSGEFRGITAFGTDTLTQGDLNSFNANGFIAKYDNSGNCLWAKQTLTTSFSRIPAVCSDDSNNIFIGGTILNSVTTYENDTLNTGGFVLKLDSMGNLIWKKTIGFSITELSADSLIYGCGSFNGTMTVDSITYSSTAGKQFTCQLDESAAVRWLIQIAGSQSGSIQTSRLYNDELIMSGSFSGTASFGNTTITPLAGGDFYIIKLSHSGQILWITSCGSDAQDQTIRLTTDNTGRIYTCGQIGSPTNYFGNLTATVAGQKDAFAGRINNGPQICGYASISPSPNDTICQGDSIVLYAAPGFSSYLWNTSETSSSIWVNSAGSYSYYAVDSAGCNYASPFVYVSVVTPVQIVLIPGDSLSSTFSTGNQWLLNGQPIPGANGQYYLPQQAGNYSVVNSLSCPDTSNIIFWSIVNVDEYPANQLNIFPNPSSDIIYINGFAPESDLTIYALDGTIVLHQECRPAVALSGLSAGTYIACIRSRNTVPGYIKIIKQ